MIVYTKRCLNCVDRVRWKVIKEFARLNGFELIEVRVSRDRNMLKSAKEVAVSHNVSIPYIEHEGRFIDINDNLEKLL